jgi:hypothetical protein
MVAHHSSTSHYSDALDDEEPFTAVEQAPPGYAERYKDIAGEYPVEKQAGGAGLSGAGVTGVQAGAGVADDGMTEAERKEWEQFYAEQKEEERVKALVSGQGDVGLTPPLTTTVTAGSPGTSDTPPVYEGGVADLTKGVEKQKLDEGESLR